MCVRSFRRTLICLLPIILISFLVPPTSFARTIEGKVVKVADGDTITVLDSNKEQHRIRLAGIDAPEKGQPFGNAPRKKLRELVAGKEVRVEFEQYDRYGRVVGKVLVKPPDCPSCGKTLDTGLMQITTGMAWWYRKYAHEQSPEDQGLYKFTGRKRKQRRLGYGKIRIRYRHGSSGENSR